MSQSAEQSVKVTRRRQIDPTTCERDYTYEEVEFMNALNAYKRNSGRMFPTCSEILEVLISLGYSKNTPPAPSSEFEENPDEKESDPIDITPALAFDINYKDEVPWQPAVISH